MLSSFSHLSRKVVLIENATTPFGIRLIKELLSKAYKIYAGYKTLHRATKLRSITRGERFVTSIPLDITCKHSVHNAISYIRADCGVLNQVICATEPKFYGPAESLSVEELQELFTENVFGIKRLLDNVIDLLQVSDHSRFILLNTAVTAPSLDLGAYDMSKVALESMVASQRLVFDDNVDLVTIDVMPNVSTLGPIKFGARLQDLTWKRQLIKARKQWELTLGSMDFLPLIDIVSYVMRTRRPSEYYCVDCEVVGLKEEG